MISLLIVLLGWSSARISEAQTEVQPTPPPQQGESPQVQQIASKQSTQDDQQSSINVPEIGKATRGVLGGKHDFSLMTGRTADACGACHVPHVQAVRPKPGEGEPFSLAFYKMGGQRDVFVPDRYMPGPASLICLSCHNGAVASSTVASSHVLLSSHRAGFEIGGFATRDHPIGIEYPDRRKGYRPRAQVLQSVAVSLPQGRIECISCHDPHDSAGIEKMLVMANRRSALCLSCHEK